MEKKHQNNLALFKAMTGKSVISAPKMSEPKMQYFGSKIERYFK
jgi:hypothetical protein